MKKLPILSILIMALVACSRQSSQPSSALPIWERKSAPAVILGRYINWQPGDKSYPPGFWGNQGNLKGNAFPKITIDSTAGRFTLEWDICYPLKHNFHGWSLILFPGDTVKLDVNRAALADYEAYMKPPADNVTTLKLQELWNKAVRIEGGTFEQPLPIHIRGMELGVSRDYAETHAHDTFDEWREVCWSEFQDVVKQLDSLNLSTSEKDYRRMLIEQDYLNKLRNFMFVKKSWKMVTDKDSLDMYEQQFTFKDPHAAELTYYRSITGFYACLANLFNEGKEYIEANGLETSPLGRWFKELDTAHAVMNRVKAKEPVSDSELNALAPEFQAQIREVQAQLQQEADDSKGKTCDLPEGEPQEWLPKIVAEHKGHFVFVDFWATWCGPCRVGMKEMEQMKDELTARGVDFIYITDTSSSTDEWLKCVGQHAGDHFIVPKDKMKEMQIPDYDNAIPHYLIYDREGKLVKAIVGWPGLEEMKAKLTEALKD